MGSHSDWGRYGAVLFCFYRKVERLFRHGLFNSDPETICLSAPYRSSHLTGHSNTSNEDYQMARTWAPNLAPYLAFFPSPDPLHAHPKAAVEGINYVAERASL